MAEMLNKAFVAIDEYNSRDPHTEAVDGARKSRELVYGQRMTEWLDRYSPDAPEYLRIAARAQHIGRWEIPRTDYPMDRKGYLQWRSAEKFHHCNVIEPILISVGYDQDTIEKVKFLLLKKELATNSDTQLLEDVVCLVFIQYYLADFAAQHDDEKVVDILRKTIKKITPRCLQEISKLKVNDRIATLLQKAATSN